MSSNDLITALQKNDKAAQKEAFDRYYGKLAAIASRYAKNQQQAEEMLNVGFEACFQKLTHQRSPQFTDLEEFFKREFITECVNYIKNIRSEYYVSSTVHASSQTPTRNYNLFDNNELIDFNNIETEQLVRGLQQMVPSQRLIFNLHVIDGLSLTEAAAVLESSEATVKSNLEKARFNFQKNIEKSFKNIRV